MLRPGRRAGGRPRRAPRLHRLGRALPDRQRRLPGLLARRAAQARRGGRALPEPHRRHGAPPLPRAVDGDPAEPRGRHRDGLRRVPARGRPARGGRRGDRPHDPLGAAQPRPPTAARTSGCSASCRAGSTSTCARRAPASSWSSTSRATRSAGSRSASPSRAATGCSSTSTRSCPRTSPRYLMGVGHARGPHRRAWRAGIDMFDCVLPTRNARNGQLFTRRGRLSIRNARFRDDPRPPDPDCPCPTCRTREPRLPPPPAPGGGDDGRDPDDRPQPVLLP